MGYTEQLISDLHLEGKTDIALACCDGWIDELKGHIAKLARRPSKADVVLDLKAKLKEARALKRTITKEAQ